VKLTGLTKEENQQLLASNICKVNIDHHPSNIFYGDTNIVITHAASTTQIITELFGQLHYKITPDIATCLLNGMYTDTGSFQHDNTTPEALAVASKLMSRGADFKAIARSNFHSLRISTLRLWGKVFENMQQNEKNITSSVVTEDDMTAIGARYEELEGVVDFLNHVPKTYFTVLLSERGDVIKGSLRTTRDDVDVSKVAGLFKGGGHKKAAGFALPGKIRKNDAVWKIFE
jgi:phosphoesterase RecJ-like protein